MKMSLQAFKSIARARVKLPNYEIGIDNNGQYIIYTGLYVLDPDNEKDMERHASDKS